MKTFIVFMAFLLLLTSCLIYSEDVNNYIQLQDYLKALAEECAAGGAFMLSYDEKEKKYVIQESEAKKYAEFLVNKNDRGTNNFSASIHPVSNGDVSIISVERFVNKEHNESIKIVSQWKAHDGYRLMRLSFLPSPSVVTMSSIYEVKQ